jgi:hypothetical protein
VWFVLGNCFVPAGIWGLVRFGQETPLRQEYTVSAAPQTVKDLAVRFDAGWTGPERNQFKTWRWATEQKASLVVENKGQGSLNVDLSFRALSLARRDLSVSLAGRTLWSGAIGEKYASAAILIPGLVLPPGPSELTFSTPQAPQTAGTDDPRPLTFMITDLVVKAGPVP